MKKRSLAGRLRKDTFECAVSAMFAHNPQTQRSRADTKAQTNLARQILAQSENGIGVFKGARHQRKLPDTARVKSNFHGEVSLKEYRHALHPTSKLLLGPQYARIPRDQKQTMKEDLGKTNGRLQEDYRLRTSRHPGLMKPDKMLPAHSLGPLYRRSNIYRNAEKLNAAVCVIQRCWRSYKNKKEFGMKIHYLKKMKEESNAARIGSMNFDTSSPQKMGTRNYTPQGSVSVLPVGSLAKVQSTSKLTAPRSGHRAQKVSILPIEELESSNSSSRLEMPGSMHLEIPVDQGAVEGVSLALASTELQKLIMDCCKKNNLPKLEGVLTPVAAADVNTRDKLGNPPVWYACKHGNKAMICYLLERGALTNILGAGGDSPLHNAFLSGNKQAVQVLIEAGASPNLVNTQGETPICYANKLLVKEMGLEQAVCKVTHERAEFDNRMFFDYYNPQHTKRVYPTELSSLIMTARSKKYVMNYTEMSTEYTRFK